MKIKNLKLRSKRSQGGVFGLSFGTIWGIILIVFFIIIAFIAIRAFINYQRNASIGLFFRELQSDVDKAWNSQSASFTFNSSLPSGSEYVCFINLSGPIREASNIEGELYNIISHTNWVAGKNAYLYAPDKDFAIKWITINHIDLSEKNPICIAVLRDNTVSIKIQKEFDNRLVKLSA